MQLPKLTLNTKTMPNFKKKKAENKITRLEARTQTAGRQRRIAKQYMKAEGTKSKKDIKITKLTMKAADIHAENVRLGQVDSKQGIKKMVAGGERYANIVGRVKGLDPTGKTSGYNMTQGSKEVSSPTSFSSDVPINYSASISNFSNTINTLKTERGNVSENFVTVGAKNPFTGKGPATVAANLYHSGDFKGAAKTLKKAALSGISYGPQNEASTYLQSTPMPTELLQGGAESAKFSKSDIRQSFREYKKTI